MQTTRFIIQHYNLTTEEYEKILEVIKLWMKPKHIQLTTFNFYPLTYLNSEAIDQKQEKHDKIDNWKQAETNYKIN